jgi:ABC-type glycerol-3-phosphate transport system substrate-binding protein
MRVLPTSRREFLKAAAATIGAGVLARPGRQTRATTAAAVPAVRTPASEPQGILWGVNYAPHVQAYRRMAALFKQQTGATVLVQPQPWPIQTRQPGAPYATLISAMAAGTAPDVVFVLASLVRPFALQGALSTLNESVLTAQLGPGYRSFFVGDALEAFTFQGKTFGVPSEADGGLGLVVSVPVDDVAKRGLGAHYPPTNGQAYFKSTPGPIEHAYDDLFALAQALQIVKKGQVVRYGLSGEGWEDVAIGSIMATLGVPVFDAVHERFNFTTPAAVHAMQLHVELPVKRGIEREWVSEDVTTLPLEGRVAMSIGNSAPIFNGRQYGYHFEPAVVPKINGQLRALGTGEIFGTVGPAQPAHPRLQTAFLRMMCTNAGQEAYLLTYQGVNAVAWKWALTNLERYQPKNETNGNWVAWQQGWLPHILETCQFVGPAGYWSKVTTAITAACEGVRLGKLTSAQGCAQIQQAAEVQYRQYKSDLASVQ